MFVLEVVKINLLKPDPLIRNVLMIFWFGYLNIHTGIANLFAVL